MFVKKESSLMAVFLLGDNEVNHKIKFPLIRKKKEIKVHADLVLSQLILVNYI
jgi:hypothetical protein